MTGVRTEYTVSVDVAAVHRSQSTVDLASLLALVGDLAEAGCSSAVWRELLAFRDHREAVQTAHMDMGMDGSVLQRGLGREC